MEGEVRGEQLQLGSDIVPPFGKMIHDWPCENNIAQSESSTDINGSKESGKLDCPALISIPRSITPPPTPGKSLSRPSFWCNSNCAKFDTSTNQNDLNQRGCYFDRFCRPRGTGSDDWTDEDDESQSSESAKSQSPLNCVLSDPSRSFFPVMTSINDDESGTLLFPMKTEKDATPTDNDTPDLPHTVSAEVLETDDEDTLPGATVKWKGLTPLEMVESVATMVETKLSLVERRSMKKLAIDTSYLALKTPELPPPVPAFRRNVGRNSAGSASGGKRSRENDVVDDSCMEPIEPTSTSTSFVPFKLKKWDLSFVLDHDKSEETVQDLIELKRLVNLVEGRPNIRQISSSYYRIQDDFLMTMQEIGDENRDDQSSKKEEMISMLFKTTIPKLVALIKMSVELSEQKGTVVLHPPFEHPALHKEKRQPTQEPFNKKEYSKRGDLAEHMGEWLKQNWTNPYPDDEVLVKMSEKCGTSPSVVSNWLINARTRKWRPAIMKAYDLGRPADMLKEDAINIFEKKPVRKID
mmetsp:Transcript_11399/g.25017  ORF Transcript_11399/g.25017 Transcript_11399/m.25017 type:complete len:523 (-) Transcript_11399:372-1940(-)|eukprot:CAMPEP_0113297364 /NCGR_PEP_ID=MMETSP0010_2-20120614/259_1 /TAXON_ID=216773 ORGANISM="Corethron hystrix, Strain 308" /NCGR_SAMPLE_ID=MMETSP0010_2 /ASSEMBLY_ACC=CAM_ASM_000155 /LENGTH=522 /DNA_ID=CAMNT_0000150245 /DNA_START=105 /DNA_END=1673 /DNA_ORIENTATION=+ /assembly_acc=CAM_ASM_000155